jgi:hypothetical protein
MDLERRTFTVGMIATGVGAITEARNGPASSCSRAMATSGPATRRIVPSSKN